MFHTRLYIKVYTARLIDTTWSEFKLYFLFLAGILIVLTDDTGIEKEQASYRQTCHHFKVQSVLHCTLKMFPYEIVHEVSNSLQFNLFLIINFISTNIQYRHFRILNTTLLYLNYYTKYLNIQHFSTHFFEKKFLKFVNCAQIDCKKGLFCMNVRCCT